ncbi:hypothetical protein [Anaerotalea alkaliphila]|uniref:Polymerase/histidinol phosphatase N-terminal domain-containing protein n=1 Tax=Anaerotalea alkaliphila TaxID=2662126 RepID=A0A7X5HUP5_9FIRM|nr:hypothetical protein [Anaerotalea alkaliphila]NDL66987.1 hypothetical protein [Anaerotalea alkaliphila]
MNRKRTISLALSLTLLASTAMGAAQDVFAAAPAGETDYHILNPYASVDWDSFGQYKTEFHSHTIESDGNATPQAMIEEYYSKGYDVLAVTDHNFTNTTWDRTDRPENRPYLTTGRLAEITAGVDRDGRGMVAIPYSNEQSRHDHLNTFWADFNNAPGDTLEQSVATAEALGGLSHINHPGRYTGARSASFEQGEIISKNPAVVAKYTDLFFKYNSLVGMEIINKKDGDSVSDRILWDSILQVTMPERRNVWGFSNDDAHSTAAVGYSFNMLLMPENSEENVRAAMENGTFYAVAKVAKRELGIGFVAQGSAPVIEDIRVDQQENAITIQGDNYHTIQWIADGEVIATGASIDLNDHEEHVNSYVRAQLVGEGGISFTQPFGVNTQTLGTLRETVENMDAVAGIKTSLLAKIAAMENGLLQGKENLVQLAGAFSSQVQALDGNRIPTGTAAFLLETVEGMLLNQ